MASKVSFRARALDVHKPLYVYAANELNDLAEYAAVNRNVPIMPTGMEKEEEMELHLVRAMHAQTATNTGVTPSTSKGVVIPTPRVTDDVQHYEDIYAECYTLAGALIKVEASLNVDPELCEYDLDGDDANWLLANAEVSDTDFETVMDRLEKASQRQVISLREARALMPNADDNVLQTVYDYWVEKRLRVKHALCPHVRCERRDVPATSSLATQSSPYIAFRRRAEKMQTRRNRKTDEEGYEKILKLSHDLHRATVLLEMLKKREKTKREMINLHAEVVDRRNSMRDWTGDLMSDCERQAKPAFAFTAPAKPLKRKRGRPDILSKAYLDYDDWHRSAVNAPVHSTRRSATNSMLESVDALASTSTSALLDGDYMFKRRRGCVYHAPSIDCSQHAQYHHTYLQSRANVFARPNTSTQLRYIGRTRRRIARGGRFVYDRAPEEDPVYPDTLPSTSSSAVHNYYRPKRNNCTENTASKGDCLQMVYASLPSSSRCAVQSDSGYSSPARSALPYAIVRTCHGDVCAIPITVGVSPALLAQHEQRVAQVWPSTSVATPATVDGPDVIDRLVAFQACAAVQNASFVESLKRAPEIDTGEFENGEMLPHHPLPTPSPSPNEDQQQTHNIVRLSKQLPPMTSSPPHSDGDSSSCHEAIIPISAQEQAFIRSNGQTNGHHSTNAAVR